jgi:hypothetical protein
VRYLKQAAVEDQGHDAAPYVLVDSRQSAGLHGYAGFLEAQQGPRPAQPALQDLAGELRLGAGRQHRRRPGRWCQLPGLYDQDDLKDAEPQTLRPVSGTSRPAWSPTRCRVLKISRTWPWKEAFLTCWQRLRALPVPA